MQKKIVKLLLNSIALCSMISRVVIAEESNENKYYIGNVINTGKDNGYSGKEEIDKKDPHFGWTLGQFYIDGYTRVVDGDDNLFIYSDKNGDDETFNIPKSVFGKAVHMIWGL